MSNPMISRMKKEIEMLANEPPYGCSAWPKDDKYDELEAQIQGPEDTPYDKGVFNLEIKIPQRYPFEPPQVVFTTPIYHPNIDNGGRICLDTLKMRPKGSWMPSVNISTLLTTIRLLLSNPNPDDGLMSDITNLYVQDHAKFVQVARNYTKEHAMKSLKPVPVPNQSINMNKSPSIDGTTVKNNTRISETEENGYSTNSSVDSEEYSSEDEIEPPAKRQHI